MYNVKQLAQHSKSSNQPREDIIAKDWISMPRMDVHSKPFFKLKQNVQQTTENSSFLQIIIYSSPNWTEEVKE